MSGWQEIETVRTPSFKPVRSLEKHNRAGLGAVPGRNSEKQTTSESLVAEYFRVIAQRYWILIGFAAAGAIIGIGTTVPTLPIYQARTSLDIQSLNADFMNMREVAPTGSSDSSSAETYVQTQIKLLESDTLVSRVVDRLKAEMQGEELLRRDLLSQSKALLHLPGAGQLSSLDAIQYTAKHVTVKPLGLTRLVEITCTAYTPEIAAKFCNTLTSEFAAQDREVRWNDAQKTGEWLTRQVADVRASLDVSEKKLDAVTSGNGIVLLQGGENVAQEKLRELQSELIRAQADRVSKEAQYSLSASASPDSLPSVLDSTPLKDLQAREDDLRRQIAALVPPLTEANPKVQHLRAQIKELEDAANVQRTNVVERLRNEYLAAKHREALLTSAYAAQERTVSVEAMKENQVSMLRHEVESGQQLYQTLLQRVKEAGFASAMQVSTIRVVDAAQVATTPIAPRRTSATIVGLLIGCALGLSAAFWRERSEHGLRAPGDVNRYLQLRELAVIPSASRDELLTGSKQTRSITGRSSSTLQLTNSDAEPPTPQHRLDLAVWTDRHSLTAEAYRNATYSVLLSGGTGTGAKTYVISSPNSGDGKTTVACNLALALTQANRRVLLIDGDLRRPRLHRALGVENHTGLRQVLCGELASDAKTISGVYQATTSPNLFLLSTGSGDEEPSSLLHSPRMAELLRSVAQEFDFVLIDTPPVIHMADARILAGLSDGVILVFRARTTDRNTAMEARDLFLNDGVKVVGTILNDFDPLKEGQRSYYSTYYRYHDDSPATRGTAKGLAELA